jgi:Snare region anchored in the vesicle membrane C-terminus
MGQAQEVAFNLREQRQLFSNIGDKLLSVAAKYPAVNGLLNAIRRKRSKVSTMSRLCSGRTNDQHPNPTCCGTAR